MRALDEESEKKQESLHIMLRFPPPTHWLLCDTSIGFPSLYPLDVERNIRMYVLPFVPKW